MKSDLVWCDFYSDCLDKRKKCRESVAKRVLGLASCAYWADMQLYRTTGSVQQEQESSPLTSKAEHTGGRTVGTTNNLRNCLKIKKKVLTSCLHISWFGPNQKICNIPAFIYLSVPGCWRQTEMAGIWHQAVDGCPAIPSSSAAAEGTLRRRPHAPI